MSDAERFALAARLYTAIKRSTGRVIDVIWLMQDEAYAREILRLARSGSDPECNDVAFRYEQNLRGEKAAQKAFNTMAGSTGSYPSAPASPAPAAPSPAPGLGGHYVRGLR